MTWIWNKLQMQIKCMEEDFEIKTLYLKSDTLLLADVFENFRKTLSKIAHLDPEKLL